MPGKTCNVALVGTKFMGRAHSNAYLKVGKFFDLLTTPVMHTVCARNEAELTAFADRWGWQNSSTDWQATVNNPEIDLVDVVTPNNVHAGHSIAALEAGKHVITEARMGMDAEEAHMMLDASRQFPHLVTQIVPAPQTLQVDQTIQDLIAEGYLGQLLALKLRVSDGHGRADRSDTFMNTDGPLHWRQDRLLSGYNIMGMGIWYETLMRYMGPATKVMAMTRVFTNQRKDENGVLQGVTVPDHVSVICEFAAGVQADLSWSTVTGLQTGAELWLFGSEGTIRMEGPPFD